MKRTQPSRRHVGTLPRIGGVEVRRLTDGERPYGTSEPTLPLVIEAKADSSMAFLGKLVRDNADLLRSAVHEHGAVLLRGFAMRSNREFAEVLSSLPWMLPMDRFFMPEPGRLRVEESLPVFHTDKYRKTGGSFTPGLLFHSENRNSPDVPAFISFWCSKAPSLGGETALCHVANAYRELDERVTSRLEAGHVCATMLWPRSEVTGLEGIPESELGPMLAAAGLSIEETGGREYLVLSKPSIVRHPHTQRPCLVANFSSELPELVRRLQAAFAARYSGWRWALHRVAWQHRWLLAMLQLLDLFPLMLQPGNLGPISGALIDRYRRDVIAEYARRRALIDSRRLDKKLDVSSVQALTQAVARHISVFTWRPGDVLIIDNLQVYHTGMPGLGSRDLRVILGSPLRIIPPSGSGPASVSVDEQYQTFDRRLAGARRARPNQGPSLDAWHRDA